MNFTLDTSKNARYIEANEIGFGTFGSVRRVWDLNLLTTRALKIYKEDECYDISESCIRETAYQFMLTDIGAPNMVPALDILLGENLQASLLQPLMDHDVADGIENEEYGDWNSCKKLVVGALRGLAFIHGLTPILMHRDIKPENILVDALGEAKITDFGFMRFTVDFLPSVQNSKQTAGGSQQRSTPTYAAPEMLVPKKSHDEKVDIWALGVTVLEMLQNARLSATTDKGARRKIRALRETTWGRRDQCEDELLMELLQENPIKRISADSALALPLCNPKQQTPTQLQIVSEQMYSETLADEVWEIMDMLDYTSPQTFYAACSYIRDSEGNNPALDSKHCLFAVLLAGKLYEHELWNTETLSGRLDFHMADFVLYQKLIIQHRGGRLLLPFPRSPHLFEARKRRADELSSKTKPKRKRRRRIIKKQEDSTGKRNSMAHFAGDEEDSTGKKNSMAHFVRDEKDFISVAVAAV